MGVITAREDLRSLLATVEAAVLIDDPRLLTAESTESLRSPSDDPTMRMRRTGIRTRTTDPG